MRKVDVTTLVTKGMLLLVLVSGCSQSPSQEILEATTPALTSTISTPEVGHKTQEAAPKVPSQTPAGVVSETPVGMTPAPATAEPVQDTPTAVDENVLVETNQVVSWEGMSLQRPSNQYQWEEVAAPAPDIYGFPVIAQGVMRRVVPAMQDRNVEEPKGTRFTLIRFSGTLEEWLELVRRDQSQVPIQEQTIQHVRFDITPALVYQTEFTGLSGEEGVYILKRDAETLLRIETEFINSDPIIQGLRLT